MKLRIVGTVVLALGVVALASSSAYAGNGKGNGNGKDGSAAAPAAVADTQEHGNSAEAPGQVKKEEAQAPPAAAEPSAGAQQVGVKPAGDTAHETHAPASSNETKLYGNGKTAGQIAQENGSAPSTMLHGPGNSQPHKASPCAGGHEVDVHALKGKRQSTCGGGPPPPHPTPNPHPNPTPDPGKTHDPAKGPDQTPSQSGVLQGSVIVSGAPNRPSARPQEGVDAAGVLAETRVAGRRATLPFTGFDLGGLIFVGAGLMLIGAALCRRARTVPARKSEEEVGP
jgi:hypothetical protein